MLAAFPTPEDLKGVRVSRPTQTLMSSSTHLQIASYTCFPFFQALQGTMLYLGLYAFWLLPFQVWTKWHLLFQKKNEAKKKQDGVKVSYRAIKYYNSKDMLALAGDRTVGNFVEYAILFLPLLWLHALFVDPTQSFTICALYVLFRSYYPLVYQCGFKLLWSTVPGYLVLGYLFFEVTKVAVF
jgi:hypothetical protein